MKKRTVLKLEALPTTISTLVLALMACGGEARPPHAGRFLLSAVDPEGEPFTYAAA